MRLLEISSKLLKRFPVFFLGGLLLSPMVPSLCFADPVVESLRIWRAPDSTRLVFDLSDALDHSLFELDGPDRLVIDLDTSIFAASIENLALENTPVASIRTGKRDDSSVRVVLDLKAQIKPRSFLLQPNADYGHRLVVDLFDNVEKKPTSIADVAKADRDIVIAIDAGHGGEDPGATGPGNIREKDVVMAISKELAAKIDSQAGFKAVLVRSGDYFISLRKRPELAREERADFFVSLHADAFRMPSVQGASVYALSGRGATSESAQYIADRENRADLIGGVGDLSLRDKDDQLASVLVDLSMYATMDTSLRAGAMVLAEMGNITKLHKKSVEQAGFAVLKSPDMPSLLIETGFISNPDEARKLADRTFQAKMATAIFSGIRSYFTSFPPAGTLIASRVNALPTVYVIRSGDTLSEIASRYDVPVASIKTANRIDGSTIKVGQKLEIPTT